MGIPIDFKSKWEDDSESPLIPINPPMGNNDSCSNPIRNYTQLESTNSATTPFELYPNLSQAKYEIEKRLKLLCHYNKEKEYDFIHF